MQASINWNLDSVFGGGLDGSEFRDTLSTIETTIANLSERVARRPPLEEDPDSWAELLLAFEKLEPQISDCWTYTHCLSCANTQDKEAASTESSTSNRAIYSPPYPIRSCSTCDVWLMSWN